MATNDMTDGSVAWTEAESAVGKDDDRSDYILSPDKHAAALPPRAAPLAEVLSGERVSALMERYNHFDAEANAQQKRFRRARTWAVSFAWSAALSGLVALCAYLFWADVSEGVLILAGLHAVLVVCLVVQALRLDLKDWRRKWRSARGRAEYYRLEIFDAVTQAEPSAFKDAGELIALAPLQLAYFRRYQLDVQLRYFAQRGEELRGAFGMPRWLPWLIAAFATVGLTAALLLALGVAAEQGVAAPLWTLRLLEPSVAQAATFALLLLAVSTIYGFVMTSAEPTEDRLNAERYAAAHRDLRFLKTHGYENVRRAAEAGDLATMRDFFRLAQDRLRAESAAWQSLGDIWSQRDEKEISPQTVSGLAEILAPSKTPS